MYTENIKKLLRGNSLAIQWLGLHAFTAEGADSIPGWETKIPQAAQQGQKMKLLKEGLSKWRYTPYS